MAADGSSLKVWTLAKLVILASAWNYGLHAPQILFLH